MQAAEWNAGRQVACFQARAWLLPDAFNCLMFPPPVWMGVVVDHQLTTLLLLPTPSKSEDGFPVSVSIADSTRKQTDFRILSYEALLPCLPAGGYQVSSAGW